jgi:hypothetical protein
LLSLSDTSVTCGFSEQTSLLHNQVRNTSNVISNLSSEFLEVSEPKG